MAQAARGRFNLQALLLRGRDRQSRPHENFSADELQEISSLPVMQRVRLLSNAHRREHFTDLAEMRLLLSRSGTQRQFYREYGGLLGHAGFSNPQILELSGRGRQSRSYAVAHLAFFSSRRFSPENLLFIAAHANPDRRMLLVDRTDDLLTLGWTPDEIARNLDGSAYNNGNSQLNFPSLRQQQRSQRRFEEEQARLAAPDSGRSMVDLRSPAEIATSRWALGSEDATVRDAQTFSDQVLPPNLRAHLEASTALESKNLLVLVAGLPFTADYRQSALRVGFIERAKRAFAYIDAANDPELLRDCAREATDTVDRCGDQLSHGLTRVEQTVECHRMVRGDVSPAQVFEHIRRHFNQMLVEEQAVEVAGFNEDESVETYFSLALGLARKGVQLEEVAHSSIYGERGGFAVRPETIDRVHAMIDSHQKGPSRELKALFNNHPAVAKALSRRFADEHQLLIKARDERAEAASERLFDEQASDADKREAERMLEEAGKAEANWLADKIDQCLKNPELLE